MIKLKQDTKEGLLVIFALIVMYLVFTFPMVFLEGQVESQQEQPTLEDTFVLTNGDEVIAYDSNRDGIIIIPVELSGIQIKGINKIKGDLTKVIIPEGIEKIGNEALKFLHLSEIILPNSLKYIGDEAFFNNDFSKIKLPEGIQYIGKSAFGYNEHLSIINIPSEIKVVKEKAFDFTNLSEKDKKFFKDCEIKEPIGFTKDVAVTTPKVMFHGFLLIVGIFILGYLKVNQEGDGDEDEDEDEDGE